MNVLNLDMDGVLVDLVGGINKSWRQGRPLTLRGDWNLNKIFNFDAVTKIENASDTWWANLPRTTFATSLVECVTSYFEPSQIRILTKYCSPACAAGKLVWMKYNYPRLAEQIVLVSEDKAFACRKGDYLIDDRNEYISAWRACGGRGITCPQPWNSESGKDPVPHVEYMLKLYRDTEHG